MKLKQHLTPAGSHRVVTSGRALWLRVKVRARWVVACVCCARFICCWQMQLFKLAKWTGGSRIFAPLLFVIIGYMLFLYWWIINCSRAGNFCVVYFASNQLSARVVEGLVVWASYGQKSSGSSPWIWPFPLRTLCAQPQRGTKVIRRRRGRLEHANFLTHLAQYFLTQGIQ